MTRFRRCKTLGENYSQEAIVERIAKEDLSFYQSQNEEKQAAIVKCYVKRYRRAKMSGLQKRYYAKLYRIGKLKKKPYSQVWKYKDDIRKMHKLQEQYLFLVRHKIESAEELVSVLDNLTDKKKEASKEKSKTYKAKERFKDILTRLNRSGGLMMRNRVIRVGIPSLKMSTMHGKGLTLSFWHRDTVWKRSRVLEKI